MRGKQAIAILGLMIGLCGGTREAAAQKRAAKVVAPTPPAADDYDEQFARFLRDSKAAAGKPEEWGWMANLSLDPRARKVNDLITIHVVESIAASGTADSALAKSSDVKAGVPTLLGLQKLLPSAVDPTSLASVKADSGFKGSGTTNRKGDLTANLTARVADVLPNGDLVVEGVREIEINGDRQMVVLSGVIRVADIATGNVVVSTSIGQLRIRYFGRGLMKDNMNPGWLVRVLNKVF